jgi:hypothetical protein
VNDSVRQADNAYVFDASQVAHKLRPNVVLTEGQHKNQEVKKDHRLARALQKVCFIFLPP